MIISVPKTWNSDHRSRQRSSADATLVAFPVLRGDFSWLFEAPVCALFSIVLLLVLFMRLITENAAARGDMYDVEDEVEDVDCMFDNSNQEKQSKQRSKTSL